MSSQKIKILRKNQRAGRSNLDNYILFSIGLVLVFFLAGCSQNNPTGPNSSPAIIKGRVEGNSGMNKASSTSSGVQGATVILTEVRADGSFQTISNAAVQTDVDGKFTLETNVNGNSDLMVIATKDSSQWMAVVASTVNSNSTVYVRPLDDESTVMASIFIKAKADNYTNVSYTGIENYINANIAAQIKGNSSLISETAASLNSEANAEAASSSAMGISQTQWQAIINAQETAQANLDEDLYNSSSPDDSNAYNIYYQSLINAYVSSGVSADTYGKLMVISNNTLLKSTAKFNSQLSFYFEQSAAYLQAKITSYAVQAKFMTMGATNTEIEALANANTALCSSIKNDSQSSEIDNDFSNYQVQVLAELKLIFNNNQAAITAISSSTKLFDSTFESEISSSSSTDDMITAYNNFYSNVNSSVAASLGTDNQSQLKAMTDTMVLVYGSN